MGFAWFIVAGAMLFSPMLGAFGGSKETKEVEFTISEKPAPGPMITLSSEDTTTTLAPVPSEITFQPGPTGDAPLVLKANGDFIYRGRVVTKDKEVYALMKAFITGACEK